MSAVWTVAGIAALWVGVYVAPAWIERGCVRAYSWWRRRRMAAAVRAERRTVPDSV